MEGSNDVMWYVCVGHGLARCVGVRGVGPIRQIMDDEYGAWSELWEGYSREGGVFFSNLSSDTRTRSSASRLVSYNTSIMYARKAVVFNILTHMNLYVHIKDTYVGVSNQHATLH